VNEDQAPRQNRDGYPCPPWCVTDHDQELIPGHFTTAHGGEGVSVCWISARAVLHPARGDRDAEVQVSVPGIDGGSLFLEAKRAGYLAILVGELAEATPEQHRELAAAIRQVAAQIAAPPPEERAPCPDHRPVLDSEAGWYCAACGSDAGGAQ
jgi:hypothetical protein